MPKARRQVAHDSATAPTSMDRNTDRIDRMERQLSTLMELLIRREQPAIAAEPLPAPIVERTPVRPSRAAVAPHELTNHPEPKRQRKARQMKPRRLYTASQITDPKQLAQLRDLTPAASAILVYLTSHGATSVPDLTIQLDLKRKTVENLLSLLKRQGLIQAKEIRQSS